MKILIALVVLLLAKPAEATLYAFRVTNWPMPIMGYLDTAVGDGVGAMYVQGYEQHWHLTGFDSWWRTTPLVRDGWHQCLVIHPEEPWLVGNIIWQGQTGKMDILSTSGTMWEFDLTVEVVIGGEPDRRAL